MSINPLKLLGLNVAAGAILAGVVLGNPLLTGAGLTAFSALLGKRPGSGTRSNLARRQQGILIQNREVTNDPIPVVYGTAKLGVLLADKRVDENSTDNEDLYLPWFVCHGSRDGEGIGAIDDLWFNDQLAVNSGGTIQAPYSASTLAVAKLLGTSTQDFSAASIGGSDLDTLFTAWDNTDNGKGLAGAILKLTYDQTVYVSGVPVVTAKIRGNFVEDNRSEITSTSLTYAAAGKTITRASGSFVTDGYVANDRVASSGSASNNATFTINTVSATVLTVDEAVVNEGPTSAPTLKRWAHPDNGADNPALCVRDYLLSTVYGAGVAAGLIDESSFNTMANFYDELVAVPDDAGGSRNQKRFTCNGWLNTGRSIRANLDELLSSCRGNLVFEGGTFRLFTTRAVTPSTIAITQANIIGDWQFFNAGNDEKVNLARGVIVDPDKSYQPDLVQWPNAGAANSYLTADNSFEKRLELDLPFTNEDHRAEQILLVLLKESRQGITAYVTCTEEALQLQIGDVVPVTEDTPGWSAKNFWVMGMGLLQHQGQVRLALREYDATAYTYDAQSDATQEPNTNLPNPFTVTAPTNLVLTAQVRETSAAGIVPQITVTWTDTAEAFIDRYEVQAKWNSASDWQPFGQEPQGVGTHIVSPTPVELSNTSWDVRIRAVNTLGAASSWVQDTVAVSLVARLEPYEMEFQRRERLLGVPRDTPSDARWIFLFEDGSGTTALNVIANTADATITAGAGSGWVEGPAGGGYDFNETGRATANHATAFDMGVAAFTMDVIFRWDANAAGDQYLIEHNTDYRLYMTSTGALRYRIRNHWATAQDPSIDLSSSALDLQGKWVHLHWQYDGASGSTFHLNGVLKATHTATGTASGAAISDDLDIGHTASANHFNGAIAYGRLTAGSRVTKPFLGDVFAQALADGDVVTENLRVATSPVGASSRLQIGTPGTWGGGATTLNLSGDNTSVGSIEFEDAGGVDGTFEYDHSAVVFRWETAAATRLFLKTGLYTQGYSGGDPGAGNMAAVGLYADDEVGVGVASPDEPLHVATETVNVGGIIQLSSDSNANAKLTFRKSNNTIASPNAITTGHLTGQIQFAGHDGTDWYVGADIYAITSGTIALNRVATDVVFRTSPDSTGGLAEQFRLMTGGDDRVGTGSAIATSATDGFLLIPGCAGTPTGNPTNDGVGAVALVYDTTNNLLYANDGGGWNAV